MLKVTGYFVYYRFINLAIVTPDAYNVVDKELEPLGKQHYPPAGGGELWAASKRETNQNCRQSWLPSRFAD